MVEEFTIYKGWYVWEPSIPIQGSKLLLDEEIPRKYNGMQDTLKLFSSKPFFPIWLIVLVGVMYGYYFHHRLIMVLSLAIPIAVYLHVFTVIGPRLRHGVLCVLRLSKIPTFTGKAAGYTSEAILSPESYHWMGDTAPEHFTGSNKPKFTIPIVKGPVAYLFEKHQSVDLLFLYCQSQGYIECIGLRRGSDVESVDSLVHVDELQKLNQLLRKAPYDKAKLRRNILLGSVLTGIFLYLYFVAFR